jgi:hypothetical protein
MATSSLLKPRRRTQRQLHTPLPGARSSASIHDKLEIVANFLTEEQDIKGTVAGLRLCRELVRTSAFDGVRANEMAPGADVQDGCLCPWERSVCLPSSGCQRYATRANSEAAIKEYIEIFYNRQRRYSRFGYVLPAAFAEKFSKVVLAA